MICSDMASTGVLGKPNEYFIKAINMWQQKAKIDDIKNYLEEVSKISASPNGVQAVKIMSNQIAPLGAIFNAIEESDSNNNFDAFFNYFSDYKIVRITRRDKVAQAVSRIMAEHTGIYHYIDSAESFLNLGHSSSSNRDETGIEYSYDLIQNTIHAIRKEEKLIEKILEAYSLQYLNVEYETSVKSRSYINEITNLVALPKITTFSDRPIKKVGGLISKEWIERFRKEKSNLAMSSDSYEPK